MMVESSYPASAEPVAMWQWRCFIAGRWGGWLPVDDVDKLRNGDWKFNFDNGTAELRPLYAAPQPLSVDARRPADCGDWRDDPSSDERWNAGVDFIMCELCDFIGVDPHTVNWDAATETVEGDVHAVIGNILRAKLGEDWSPSVSSTARGAPERWEDRRVDETGPEYEARTGKLVTGTPLTSPEVK